MMTRSIKWLFLCLCLASCETRDISNNTPEVSATETLNWQQQATPRVVGDTSGVYNAPVIGENGELYLGGQHLLPNPQEVCNVGVASEISYAPTNDKFLVLVWCWESVHQGIVFEVDSNLGQQITSDFDVIFGNRYSWSPDGRWLTYSRAWCCGEVMPMLPFGLVAYDTETGDKKLLTTQVPWTVPQWSPDGKWIAFLSPDSQPEMSTIYLVSPDGIQQWIVDKVEDDWPSGNLLWEKRDSGRIELKYTSLRGDVVNTYQYDSASTPPIDTAIPVTPSAP